MDGPGDARGKLGRFWINSAGSPHSWLGQTRGPMRTLTNETIESKTAPVGSVNMFIGNFDVGALIERVAPWGFVGLCLLVIAGLIVASGKASREVAEDKATKKQALKALQEDYIAKAEDEGRTLYQIKGDDDHLLSLDEKGLTVAIDGQEWPCSAIRGVEVVSNGHRVASSVDIGNAAGVAAIGLIALVPGITVG